MHWVGPPINLYSCLMKTVGGRYFWPLLTTVNKLTVFIWFSKQNTYSNISDRLVFKDLMQGSLKSI